MTYPTHGGWPVIPAADLINLRSNANMLGDSRVGASPVLGKRPGMNAWRDGGSSAYIWVFSTGGKTSDAWRACDGSASYTPLNLSTWTVGADSTYSSGLLTTDGGNDAAGRVAQTITALAAGTYIVSGSAAAEGVVANHVAPRLRVTGSVTSSIITKVFRTVLHPTAAESASPKESFAFAITVPSAQNVTFTFDVVDEDDVLAAGSSYITFNPLEAINA